MIEILIKGMAEYEGWTGFLCPMVSNSSAQGAVFSTMIAPNPDTQPIEVYLPQAFIHRLADEADRSALPAGDTRSQSAES